MFASDAGYASEDSELGRYAAAALFPQSHCEDVYEPPRLESVPVGTCAALVVQSHAQPLQWRRPVSH